MVKSIKISDTTYKKAKALANKLSKKEFSGANIGLSDAIGYAVAKALENSRGLAWPKIRI